ncbi:uncharacterized protein LOC118437201 [Folsomia candida]|uniref:DNA repair protein RAD5 n=1 Tax=Folsomia candida TaxID=158441 RepID=A0A226CXC2_FOLCA|nr:uncharacterized protein LOC118433616 [Folsomia candida]XP_035711974.1 uncharacterized protein LOC118437201 [Folsomia candida]OXA37188.1 DNA repair protein RAD5 [Folsomia candida]
MNSPSSSIGSCSSTTSKTLCLICDELPAMYTIAANNNAGDGTKPCGHHYCVQCLIKHVSSSASGDQFSPTHQPRCPFCVRDICGFLPLDSANSSLQLVRQKDFDGTIGEITNPYTDEKLMGTVYQDLTYLSILRMEEQIPPVIPFEKMSPVHAEPSCPPHRYTCVECDLHFLTVQGIVRHEARNH